MKLKIDKDEKYGEVGYFWLKKNKDGSITVCWENEMYHENPWNIITLHENMEYEFHDGCNFKEKEND